MGLDMYAHKVRLNPAGPRLQVDFELPDDAEELFYWRKHPNPHGWMRERYLAKGGADPDFNCRNLALDEDDLLALREAVNSDHLPETTGFFFGTSTPEDKVDDLRFIELAMQARRDGYEVVYSAWY